MDQPNQSIFLQTFSVCERASPRHFPSSSQPFSHIQAQQRLCSDPSTRCYCHQLVAHQPGHTATPRQKELCNGRPKRTKAGRIMTTTSIYACIHFLSLIRGQVWLLQPPSILEKRKNIIVPTATQTHWLIKNKKNQVVNLLGRAEKLEKTYRAIMSRHVSVSSRWTVFSPSSAWVTAFSSAEPRLQVVVEVCILHEATGRGLKHDKEGRGGGGGRHTGSRYILTCNQCTQRHASSDIQTERNAARHNNSHSPMSMFLTIPHAMQAFISTHASICVYIRKYTNRITFSHTNTDTRWDVV